MTPNVPVKTTHNTEAQITTDMPRIEVPAILNNAAIGISGGIVLLSFSRGQGSAARIVWQAVWLAIIRPNVFNKFLKSLWRACKTVCAT